MRCLMCVSLQDLVLEAHAVRSTHAVNERRSTHAVNERSVCLLDLYIAQTLPVIHH